jgi:hypothetical protein
MVNASRNAHSWRITGELEILYHQDNLQLLGELLIINVHL